MPKHINFKNKKIAIKSLTLWDENARFPDKYFNQSEEELVAFFLSKPKFKIKSLAEAIVKDSDLPQIEKFIIFDDGERLIAIEGNRRLTAYKLLSNPEMIPEGKIKLFFRQLSEKVNIDQDFLVDCLVLDSKENGLRYLDRKHVHGNNEVRWQDTERANYNKRRGNAKKEELFKVAISKIVRELDLPESFKDNVLGFGYQTTFYRIIKSGPAWDLFRFHLDKKGNLTFGDQNFKDKLRVIVVNVLNKSDFSGKKLDSRSLNTNKEIEEYLQSIDEEEYSEVKKFIDKHTQENLLGEKSIILGKKKYKQNSEDDFEPTGPIKRYSVQHKPKYKRKKIPSSLNVLIKECYDIDENQHPNAKLALTRVVFECTLKYVVENTLFNGKKNISDSDFFKKAFFDKKANKRTYTNFKILKHRFVDLINNTGMSNAFKSFELIKPHQIIHNYKVGATPSDAKTTCDNLTPLIEFMLKEETDLLGSLDLSKL